MTEAEIQEFQKTKKYYSAPRAEMLNYIPSDAKKILDVGCGMGGFSETMLMSGREVWGIEMVEKSAKEAQKKLHKVMVGKAEDVLDQLPDHYFDVIVFNDVLEHMTDPWEVVTKLKVKLNDKGCLVCSIPNFRYIKNVKHVFIDGDWEYTDHGILDSTHFRYFTKKNIVRFFDQCGYKIDKIEGVNKTKSIKYQLLWLYLNLTTVTFKNDMLNMQFAVIAKPLK